MKLKSVEIENYRAIEKLKLSLDPSLTVLHGENGYGKTSVLSAIAVGLGAIPEMLFDISELDFQEEDLREGAEHSRVSLTAIDGAFWKHQSGREDDQMKARRQIAMAHFWESQITDKVVDIPIAAFYSTHLISPLDARMDFNRLFTWYREAEKLKRENRRKPDHQPKDISAVCQAISSMLPEVSDLHTELHPPRFVVSRRSEPGQVEKLSLDQLSGGYRVVLLLAADLARRMVTGNPHRDNPLESEAVVLIDDVELHLHPAWQQRILGDLQRTFPNAQFIVSTHSPQVLTTVEPQRIVELYWDGDYIAARAPAISTYGAEAGDVLSVVMGVKERPENEFTKALERYRRLVSEGEGESEEALALRRKLEELSPRDYALNRADLEIRQRKMFKRMAESQ